MVIIVLMAALLVVSEGLSEKLKQPSNRLKRAIPIVGGEPEEISEFPYLIQVHFRIPGGKEDRCGASAVGERWALTAAHCIKNLENATRYLVWNSTIWEPWQNDPEVPVDCKKDCFVHPQYVEITHDNDVALIYLSGERVLSRSQLILLGTTTPRPRTLLHVAGWGKGPEEPMFDYLHEVYVPVVKMANCNKSYDGGITQHMLCAGYDKGGKDACGGDSGGGAVERRRDGEFAVVGIVSFGFFCAVPRYYGVYVDVASERSWIDSTMASR